MGDGEHGPGEQGVRARYLCFRAARGKADPFAWLTCLQNVGQLHPLAIVMGSIVLCMIGYFVLSIVNQMAQKNRHRIDKQLYADLLRGWRGRSLAVLTTGLLPAGSLAKSSRARVASWRVFCALG